MTNPYREALASILPAAKAELEHGDMDARDRIALEHDIDAASALLDRPPQPDTAAILRAFAVGRAIGHIERDLDEARLLAPAAQKFYHDGMRGSIGMIDRHLSTLPEPHRAALIEPVARMKAKVAESFARAGVTL